MKKSTVTTHRVEVREAKYHIGYEVVDQAGDSVKVVARTFSANSQELARCVADLIIQRNIK